VLLVRIESLFFPRIAADVVTVLFQKPGSSCAVSSNPRTHFTLFQRYRCGTIRRTG